VDVARQPPPLSDPEGAPFEQYRAQTQHPGYSIDETMTATVGRALTENGQGYISADGAALMNALVEVQRQNLYGSASSSMVAARTKISEALCAVITSTSPSADELAQVKAEVDAWSRTYGKLDGENVAAHSTTFHRLCNNVGGTYMTTAQKTSLVALPNSMLGSYTSDAFTDQCFKRF
jgi:hypothetical protein